MDHDPVTILAIPRSISPGESWNEVTANSIIFERFRLVESLNSPIPDAHKAYVKDLILDFRKFVVSHLE
jgi:hypothetical protein